jgi:hypothetical protein
MTARYLLALKGQRKFVNLKFLSAWESKEFAGVVHLFAVWMELFQVLHAAIHIMSLIFTSLPGAYYIFKLL